jgi:mono/diheme cytochrome c family protein
MARFVAGLAVGVVLVIALEYAFLTEGGMPVAARDARPLPLETFVTGRALQVAVAKESSRLSPLPADEPNLLAGARTYRENCMACHGVFGEKQRTAAAQGMFPRPPRLLPPGKGVTDDPVGETFWKAKNGIRLSGMPGFGGSLPDDALWQVSLLLANADHLPPNVSAELR